MMSLTTARTPFVYHHRRGHGPPLCRALALGCGLLLGGCAALCDEYTDDSGVRSARRAPTADTATFAGRKAALLRPPRKPACESESADMRSAAAGAPNTTTADLALRIKLEYDRECYRQAERRVRAQLQSLQAAVADATKAHGAPASGTAGGPSGSP